MPVDDTIPEDFAGQDQMEPSYFRIFFAAITATGGLVYKDQTEMNGPFAEDFTSLSTLNYQPSHLNAAGTQNGYVALLAADSASGHLTYLHEDGRPGATDRFAAPVDLGKPDGVTGYEDTLMINGVTNRLNVFVTSSSPDNAIWWKFQNPNTVREITESVVPPGMQDPVEVTVMEETPPSQPWSDWQQLPGALCSVTGTQNVDGRIILAGLNSDNVPYMNMQTNDHPFLPEGWLGWQEISGGLSGFDQLICGVGVNALVHIFARIGQTIYVKVQQEVSSASFSDWALFASFTAPVQTMALSIAANDGLYLVAQVGSATNSPIYAKYQTGSVWDEWSAPQVIGYVDGDSTLVLQPNANTSLDLFALNSTTGEAAYLEQQTLGHWSATWGSLGGDLSTMAVTQDVTANPD